MYDWLIIVIIEEFLKKIRKGINHNRMSVNQQLCFMLLFFIKLIKLRMHILITSISLEE